MHQSSPQEIRDIFRTNLRRLVSREASVNRLCNEIGINRTQFNRYLNGDAHPRPDILHRICTHFGTDARILLEPLESLTRPTLSMDGMVRELQPFLKRMSEFDHRRMPDGYYRMVRPSPVVQDKMLVSLLILKTMTDGSKRAMAAIPAFYFEGMDWKRAWPARRLDSLAFQHIEGASFLFGSRYGSLLQLCFVTGGFLVSGHLHSGFSAYTQVGSPAQAQIVPLILELVGTTFAEGIRARRSAGTYNRSELKRHERQYFDSWNPLGSYIPNRAGS